MMGLAFGIGFVVGPALGGLLGSIDARLPFYTAAGLALANAGFGYFFLQESLAPENRRPFDWRRANAFAALQALKGQSPTVLWFVAALGMWQLAHIVYPAVWPYFAIAAYGFDTAQVGLALAMVGLGSALVQGVALRIFLPRLGERRAVVLGVTGLCAAAIIYTLARETWQVYLAIAVGALQGFVQSPIAALNSQAVDARSQGELQGAVQSVGSIAAIIGPPLYTQALARFSGPDAIINLPRNADPDFRRDFADNAGLVLEGREFAEAGEVICAGRLIGGGNAMFFVKSCLSASDPFVAVRERVAEA